MDLQYLRKLIKIVTDSQIDELEIEEEGAKVRITRQKPWAHDGSAYAPTVHVQAPPTAAAPVHTAAAPPVESAPPANIKLVRSPIVGTFYRAPAPDADPYVQVGQSIDVGTPVCIIEAMKIMNEIESDTAGKVTRILVENAQPVEYNQPLFEIETR